jgi:DNA-binding winged helix-turn-helix (wHTH) protein
MATLVMGHEPSNGTVAVGLPTAPGTVVWGPITVDLVGGFALVEGAFIELQPLQLRILGLLVVNAGTVVTKSMLRDRVFRIQQADGGTHIERQISVLRTRLGRARGLLVTVPGTGYGIGLASTSLEVREPLPQEPRRSESDRGHISGYYPAVTIGASS